MERVIFTDMNLVREEAEDSRNVVSGYAMQWNDEADLGYVRETFEPGSFKGRMDSTVMLIGHDRGIPLASVNGETLSLREDKKGLLFRASLSEDSQRAIEVLVAVERGDLTDVSIGFSMYPKGEYTIQEGDKEKSVLYKILRVASLNEVSFVYRGAYPKAKINRSEVNKDSVIQVHVQDYLSECRAEEMRVKSLNARIKIHSAKLNLFKG